MSLNNYIFNNGKRQLNKAAVMLVLIIMVIAAFVISLRTGKYPLTLKGILSGDTMQIKVLVRLRIPRAVMGVAGGFGLGIAGYVYQLVFKNRLHRLILSEYLLAQVLVLLWRLCLYRLFLLLFRL